MFGKTPSAENPPTRSKPIVAEYKPTAQQWIIIAILGSQAVMVSLDATLLTTTLPVIGSALNASTTQSFWIGTSYLLASAVPMLFIAALSNTLGRTPCLFASISLFTVGTIICCTTQTIAQMLVGRSIQGVGGGGIIILSLIIFTDIIPLRFRPKYYGLIQAAWALGTCVGPLIGGAFVQSDTGGNTWRWVFYMMFPFCAIGLVGVPLFIRLHLERPPWREYIKQIDWVGGFLSIASAVSFLIAISWGGTQYPWSSWRTIVPLVMGVVGLGITITWERYFAKEAFIRQRLFGTVTSCSVYFGTFAQGVLLNGQLFYFAFFFQSVKLDSAERAGVLLLPSLLVTLPTAAISGRVITNIGKYRWAIWSGASILTLGAGLSILWTSTSGLAVIVIVSMICGLGHGLFLNSQNAAVQAACQSGDETAAAGMYIYVRTFGSAAGIGLGSTIFQNVMIIKLKQYGLPTSIATNSETYIYTLRNMAASTEKSEIIDSYTYGFHGVFGFFCALAGAAFLASLFVKHYDIDKELNTEHKLVKVRWSRAMDQAAEGPVDEQPEMAEKDPVASGAMTSTPGAPPPPTVGIERPDSDTASSSNDERPLYPSKPDLLPRLRTGPRLSSMIDWLDPSDFSRQHSGQTSIKSRPSTIRLRW